MIRPMAYELLSLEVPLLQERKRIPMRVIRALVKHIAENFDPDQIILFGSHAYGEPEAWSDVDLLVVKDIPEDKEIETALEISDTLPSQSFSIDILVRSRKVIASRIALGDWFMREITGQGKIMYQRLVRDGGQADSNAAEEANFSDASHPRRPKRIPIRVIRGLVKPIVEHFDPDEVILFGPQAYGRLKPSSGVDFLVVKDIPEGKEIETALEISDTLPSHPFSLDILVRSRAVIEKRLALGDHFLREIIANGKRLYARPDRRMGS